MSRTYKHKLTGSKSRFHSCRNHGTCPWCTSNRTYTALRGLEKCRQQLNQLHQYGYTVEKYGTDGYGF